MTRKEHTSRYTLPPARSVALILPSLVLSMLISGCGKGTETQTESEKPATANKPSVHVPEPTKFYEGTPYWQVQSSNWPALTEGTTDSDGVYQQDSLTLRLTGNVIQSFVSGPKGLAHPIMCWIDLTARPIPKQLIGHSFKMDSVRFYDPLKKKLLPALPMLSLERFTEGAVVRTRFSNNLSFLHTPNLVDSQPLEPTVYLTTVDKKTLKLAMPPMNIRFLYEMKHEGIPTDSLKWGPS